MEAILKADYGDKDQRNSNEADRARAGAPQAVVAGVRAPSSQCPHAVSAGCLASRYSGFWVQGENSKRYTVHPEP